MLTKLKLALILSASLVGGVAAAHGFSGGTGGKAAMLQKYDTNGDGKLDDTERAAMKADFAAKRAAKKAEMLAKYDLNKNGKLDPDERAAMKSDRLTAEFAKLDANGDGKITLDEFKAGNAKLGGHGGRHHGGHRKGAGGANGGNGGQP